MSSSVLRLQTEFGIAFIPIFEKKKIAKPALRTTFLMIYISCKFPKFPIFPLLVCKSKCLYVFFCYHTYRQKNGFGEIAHNYFAPVSICSCSFSDSCVFFCSFVVLPLVQSFQKQTFIHNFPSRYSSGHSDDYYYSYNILQLWLGVIFRYYDYQFGNSE